ncbi:MAG: ANTAR domain-containing protein [Gammaproteobacteria bacterium]|nr:ANTAR domain-containing protein [Gammaproteobacteria bacterium]
MTFLQVKEPVQLNTVIIDPKEDRREMFSLMLGDRDIHLADSFQSVKEAIAADPRCELIMLCADAVTADTISDLNRLRSSEWGILVLLDTPAPADIEALVAAGADHVLPLRPQSDRFSVATSAALAQARRRSALENECHAAREALEDAKKVYRAKMILMSRHSIGEEEAHKRVQLMSMKRNMALPAMARQIIDAEDLLC